MLSTCVCSQRTIRAIEKTECLFITKETFEQSVGKLSSILEKDKIRRSRKEWISESRKTAKVGMMTLSALILSSCLFAFECMCSLCLLLPATAELTRLV